MSVWGISLSKYGWSWFKFKHLSTHAFNMNVSNMNVPQSRPDNIVSKIAFTKAFFFRPKISKNVCLLATSILLSRQNENQTTKSIFSDKVNLLLNISTIPEFTRCNRCKGFLYCKESCGFLQRHCFGHIEWNGQRYKFWNCLVFAEIWSREESHDEDWLISKNYIHV